MFALLSDPPSDPILGLAHLFRADPSPDKVDLGIGVYKDGNGRDHILDVVRQAEIALAQRQISKAYLSSAGNPAFNQSIRQLILGSADSQIERARTIQTIGGSGAVRMAAELIKKLNPAARVYLPNITWPNHPGICAAVGLEAVTYPYYDVASGRLLFDAMIEALAGVRRGDVVLLHGCCHNPSGADPDATQWRAIAELLAKQGALALVDFAYQGFGDGLEADAAGVRILAQSIPELLIASSCSKNFTLYRERVGALTLVAEDKGKVERAYGHTLPLIRSNYSMPADHGAALVAHILGDAALRQAWEAEVGAMRERIADVRAELVNRLAGRTRRNMDFLGAQRGMFALLGISKEEAEAMRVDHHVHLTSSGRINVAGLNEANVGHVADALVAIGV